jgi:hypothetical protein
VVVVDFTDAARHGPPKEHRIAAEAVAHLGGDALTAS